MQQLSANDEQEWAKRLLKLGFMIQGHLHQYVSKSSDDLAEPVGFEGGDTIFQIDRHVEPLIESAIRDWPDECKPVVLIAEGMGDDGRQVFGTSEQSARFRVIIDPIDGTRGLMYDKRSAWFIAAVAQDHGDQTNLGDAFTAVLVELATTKQGWCDAYFATRSQSTRGLRSRPGGDSPHEFLPRPSQANNLKFGFGQVSSFFPGTQALAADLNERIARENLGPEVPGQALLFNDQYISTGGQMVELMAGHDRFCCDLRPLFYRILEKGSEQIIRGVECHPYDVAGAFVAKRAGVIITDGFGRPLQCPFDVHTGIHWCGFANETLAKAIQPIITRWLLDHGIVPA